MYNYFNSSSWYDTNYLFNFDLPDGRILIFNNSMLRISSEQRENKTFRCLNIAFLGIELFYWLMQYSIFIKVEFVPTHIEYIAPKNDSPRYVPTTSNGVVHYIEGFKSDYQHMTSLLAPLIQKTTLSDTLSSYFYISITQELNCMNNAMGRMNVFFSTAMFPTNNYTKTAHVTNHMYFNGPFVYLNTMYGIMDIICMYIPHCDVVVSYQLVSVRKTVKKQEDCIHGYYKVSTRILLTWILLGKHKDDIDTCATAAKDIKKDNEHTSKLAIYPYYIKRCTIVYPPVKMNCVFYVKLCPLNFHQPIPLHWIM